MTDPNVIEAIQNMQNSVIDGMACLVAIGFCTLLYEKCKKWYSKLFMWGSILYFIVQLARLNV